MATAQVLVSSMVVLLVLLHSTSGKIRFSSMVTPCSLKDANLNECVRQAATKMVPFLSKGIREYGVVPFDPLRFPRMEIGQEDGPVTLKLTYTDVTQTGLSEMTIDKVTMDMKRGRMVFNTTHPSFQLVGNYKASGKILVLPVVGEGKVNMTQVNTKCDVVIRGHTDKRKDDVYFKLDKFRVYYRFGKANLDFSNLFNGNAELGKSTNKFLNENADEVFNGLKGALEDVYSELYGGLIRRLFDSVPYNQLFADVDS